MAGFFLLNFFKICWASSEKMCEIKVQMKNFDFSKPKQCADDNFKFDENGRKLSKRVENTVGKGEIAHYEQFLLFPQCF